MKIAILMSVYNGHRYLNEQLETLAAQTVAKNMTLYIRDDGSSDNTVEIIENWKKKIHIVLYKGKNLGPAMSFWELFMKSEIRADYYAFCDQDDLWDKDKLERAVTCLRENVHFYACNCRIVDESGKVIQKQRVRCITEITIPRLFVSGCPQGCSMVFTDSLRRFIIAANIQCVPMHDIVVILYASTFGEIFWDITPHFGYRLHSGNVVAKGNKSKIQRLKTTCWNWKNGADNSMMFVAREMLNNVTGLNEKDRKYLEWISEYKESVSSVIHALYLREFRGIPIKQLRSYWLRIILKLY